MPSLLSRRTPPTRSTTRSQARAPHTAMKVAPEFGSAWDVYAAATPRWFPRIGSTAGVRTRHAEARH